MKINRQNVAEKLKSLLEWARTVIFWGMALPVVLWSIPVTRAYLERYGFFDRESVFAIQTLALAVVLASYAQLSAAIKGVIEKIDTAHTDKEGVLLEGGVHKMHERMVQITSSIENRSEKKIWILGLNLGMSWPLVKGWLVDKKYQDWEIVFYCLAPDYVERTSFLDSKWGPYIRAHTADIHAYKDENRDLLAANRISIAVKHYSSIPAIHGFKLGNGDTFIAASQWVGKGTTLDGPAIYYEQILGSNSSKRAKFYRGLLQNWIDRADATAVEPSVEKNSTPFVPRARSTDE